MEQKLEVLERESKESFDRWHDERRKRESLKIEVDRMRSEVSELEASPLSEEALDILRSENMRLRKAMDTACTLERDGDVRGICMHLRAALTHNSEVKGGSNDK